MELKVIKGFLEESEKKKKEKENKIHLIHERLYYDYKYGFDRPYDIKKAIFHGIKFIKKINYNEASFEELLKFNLEIEDLVVMISKITYNDFINMFPIIKEYNGHKWECKDYYSTMDFLKDKNLDSIIGLDNVQNLIFEYYNQDILVFGVNQMIVVDRIVRMMGDKGLMERFLEQVDPEGKVDTYTYHKEEGYMQSNKTGKTFKVRKPKPDYLKVVK